ncbi:MAG: YraN family protein [Actinomycetaceae bacterium]|nr:YraN family protein [Actinomycetaceae bacterium]MDY6082976.1 YraN family protein [Actinomycetaceae bacterium]
MTITIEHPAYADNRWLHICMPEHLTGRELGDRGEDLACAYLVSSGWRIVNRRWRTRYGELDIVAQPANQRALVGIEVKTRRASSRVSALNAVTPIKLRRLRGLVAQYASTLPTYELLLAVDVIAITVYADGRWDLEHIRNVAS